MKERAINLTFTLVIRRTPARKIAKKRIEKWGEIKK